MGTIAAYAIKKLWGNIDVYLSTKASSLKHVVTRGQQLYTFSIVCVRGPFMLFYAGPPAIVSQC